MNSLIRYGLAGVMFFGAGISVEPEVRLQEQIPDRAGPPDKPVPASPDASVPPVSVDKAISDALAPRGDTHATPPSFFTDLIRSMEKSGFEREAAVQVAVTLAKNPKLDNLAGLTIAGSLQRYQAATRENLDEALAELVTYLEHPDQSSGRANERFGLLSPDLDRLIHEKTDNGNEAAAQLLMEEALLRRFNPPLAARIFVPSDSPPQIPAAAMPAEPLGTDQRGAAPAARILASSSTRSASRRSVIASANARSRQWRIQHPARVNSLRR